jgi:hypothetical protein
MIIFVAEFSSKYLVMTDEERKELLLYMEKALKRMNSDKEYARKLLVEVGLYTPDGELTEECKSLAPLVESGVLRRF